MDSGRVPAHFFKTWSPIRRITALALFPSPSVESSFIQTMLLGKLTCGQLTGAILRNPLRAFWRAHSRPTLQGVRFHGVIFSLIISIDYDAPRFTLTLDHVVLCHTFKRRDLNCPAQKASSCK